MLFNSTKCGSRQRSCCFRADIFKRKKLRYREDILDNMNEDELVANLFRINQTKQKLLKDNVQGEKEAKDVHYEVGKKLERQLQILVE